MPRIALHDKETGIRKARVVPKKGVHPYAVDRIKRDIEQFGHKEIIFKSDQENSIKALKQAVKESTEVRIKMEESPVAEHQSNGSVESAMNQIKGQFRTMKDALDTRYNCRHAGDHPAIPWLIEHAADTLNRRRIGKDGRTAYRRWKGRSFNKKVAEFGENIWYLKLGTAGKDKFHKRWEDGVYLGIMDGTGETIVGTENGITKAKDFRRKAIKGERWNKEATKEMQGTPSQPDAGRTGTGIPIRVSIPACEDIPLDEVVPPREEEAPRRVYISSRGACKNTAIPRNAKDAKE